MKQTTSAFLTCGLILFIVLGIIAYSIERTFFQPEVYLDVMEKREFYNNAPEWIGEFAYDQIRNLSNDSETITSNIAPETWNKVVREVLPEDWIRQTIESFINQGFLYLNSESESFEFTIDLRQVKLALIDDQSVTITQIITEALPECSEDILNQLIENLLYGRYDQIQFCRMPQPYNEYLDRFVIQTIRFMTQLVPDTIIINSDEAVKLLPPEEVERIERVVALYRHIRLGISALPFLALAWVPLLILVTFQRARDILTYFGWGFTLSGFFTIFFVLLSIPFQEAITRMLINPWVILLHPELIKSISEILLDIYFLFSGKTSVIAGLILGAGVIMLLSRRFVRGQSTERLYRLSHS